MINSLTDTARIYSEMRQQIETAQRCAGMIGIIGELRSAAQSSGLRAAQTLGKMLTEAKTFGGAIPNRAELLREAERLNDSPARRVWLELNEIREQAEREESEKQWRQTICERQNKLAKGFADYPRAEIEPVKVNVHLTVVINTAKPTNADQNADFAVSFTDAGGVIRPTD